MRPLLLLFISLMAGAGLAWAEDITVTTFYPAAANDNPCLESLRVGQAYCAQPLDPPANGVVAIQNRLGIGTRTPDVNSRLNVDSSRGTPLPRGSAAILVSDFPTETWGLRLDRAEQKLFGIHVNNNNPATLETIGARDLLLQTQQGGMGNPTPAKLFLKNATGSIGIGTTDPVGLLSLEKPGIYGRLNFFDPDADLSFDGGSDSVFVLKHRGAATGRTEFWKPDGTAILTLSNTGNVGVGTNDPKRRLHVAGDFRVDGQRMWFNRGSRENPYSFMGGLQEGVDNAMGFATYNNRRTIFVGPIGNQTPWDMTFYNGRLEVQKGWVRIHNTPPWGSRTDDSLIVEQGNVNFGRGGGSTLTVEGGDIKVPDGSLDAARQVWGGGLFARGGIASDYERKEQSTEGLLFYSGDGNAPRAGVAYQLNINYQSGGAGYYLRVLKLGIRQPQLAWINSESGWQSGSSRTMKFDIVPLSAAGYKAILDDLRNTTVYSYRRYSVPDEPEIGVISEEAPAWVRGSDDKSVSPSRWLGFLTGVVKEMDRNSMTLSEEIRELKAENEQLKSRIQALEENSGKK